MQTNMVEYYTSEEILSDLNEGFGLSLMNDVLKGLDSKTRCKDFGNYTQVPVLENDKFGRIKLQEFFENGQGDYEAFDDIQEFKEFLSSSEWICKHHDNTYNHGGYTELEIDYKVFESCESEEVIGFFAIHIGLDVRAGYTEYFPLKFENEYDFIDFITSRHDIASASFKVGNEDFNIYFSGEAVSEYLYPYVGHGSNNTYIEVDCETVSVDTYDREEFEKTLIEFLIANDVSIKVDTLVID